ncbi:MAG TPA: CCA tRNA nucleotidyltransferase [Candidatus Omnitrophota bacterium]|nr:CCA tRNA nucleotidyltransferase [Candidatus Omnitrophota bacterium]
MLVNNLENLPQDILRLFRQIGKIAQENNCRVYIVGGMIRDLYLGRENFDFDIVVEGDGIALAKKLADKFKAKLVDHEKFATAVLFVPNGIKIDIATARKETYEHPGALPNVVPGNIEDDLSRRDFSINAMAASLNPEDFGELIDFFDGLSDLKKKEIKVLHDLSFIDDPTRILRAIRFEQRLKFKIEDHSLRLIKEAVKRKAFDTVKPPRIWHELILILYERNPKKYFARISQLCSLKFIHPRLRFKKDTLRLLESVEKILNSYNRLYPDNEPVRGWFIYFIALTDRLGRREIKDVAEKFNLNREERDSLYSYKDTNRNFFSFLSKNTLLPSQIYILLEKLSYETILALRAKTVDKLAKKRIDDFLNIYDKVKLNITGDYLNDLGVSLDSNFKKILDRIFYAKLDGKLKTKEEELQLARELVKNQ